MHDLVDSDAGGVEIALALGVPIKGLTGLEIKIKGGEPIKIVADYHMSEESFSKFLVLCNKFEAKEDKDVNDHQ